MNISHNMPALYTQLSMKRNDRIMSAAMRRLSSGFKFTSAKDDATGMAIANKLSYQVASLNKASENATNGISLIQTAEGALGEVQNMLQRLRELAVQASHDTLNNDDRAKMQSEIDGLIDEIDEMANRTEFNKIKLLNGEAGRVVKSKLMNAGGTYQDNLSIATPLLVSDAVVPGILSYEITTAGLPPVIPGVTSTASGNPSNPVGSSGEFDINGYTIAFSKEDTYQQVKSKIFEACNYANIMYDDKSLPNGAVLLTGITAGSSQQIKVSGDAGILAMFGMQPGLSEGTDAVVEATMYDPNGVANLNFNNGMAIVADGNQVSITSTGGQLIKLNIQVQQSVPANGWATQTTNADGDTVFTASPADYTYGDGTTPVANGTTVTQMQLDIKDYGPIMLQTGPNYNMAIPVQIPKLTSETLGFVEYSGGKMRRLLNYQTQEQASRAITKTDEALSVVSTIRTRLGAYQNRLESTVQSLDTAIENTEASRSRIRDSDMAKEMTTYSQYNVMYQAGMAILGQANQRPQQILSLLQ